jgi:16S rRNA (uracil1498-N3)-methyltransferase
VHIACAPTKSIDRFEWFLEKATEIGITTVTPIACFNSERRQIRHDRLEKIILSATKQSLKYWLPTLEDLTAFDAFLKKYAPFDGQKFIAHCHDNEVKNSLKTAYNPSQNVLILIGPEGDFSKEEVVKALSLGFEPISLGESRLRTETAALVALHTISLLNG